MTKILKTAALAGEFCMLVVLVWVSVNKVAREGYRIEAIHVGRQLGL
jgi:hypothetical protein